MSGDVVMTDDYCNQLAVKPKVAQGRFCFLITDCEEYHKEDPAEDIGHKMRLTLRMLENPEDTGSVKGMTVRANITWPFGDSNDPSWIPSSFQVEDCCGFLNAIFPDECIDVPRLVGEKGKRKLIFKGEPCEREDEYLGRAEAVRSARDKAKEVHANLAMFIGKVFYADTKHSGDFVNLRNWSSEPAGDLCGVYEERNLDLEVMKAKRVNGSAAKNGSPRKKGGRR